MTQDQTKHKQQKQKKLMLIRYGRMGLLGWFEHKESHIPKTASRAVIKTERGLEMGELVGQFHYRGGNFKSTPEQVQEYYGKAQKDQPLTAGGYRPGPALFKTDGRLLRVSVEPGPGV